MRTFKNWKSELKKKGAMALTAFMLCGSAGTAFAQSTTPIAILDGTEGSIGNVKTVTGYQTDETSGYAANIIWGDMLFVYDRGKYEPSLGKRIGSFGDSNEEIEMSGDPAKAGYWYGFDGENNAVKIQNLSTAAVKLTATPEVTRTEAENVKFSLYVSSNQKTWESTSLASDNRLIVAHDPNEDDTDKSDWYVGTSGGAISRVFDACTFKDDGTADKTDSDFIYLNITGKPDDAFMNATDYNKNTPKVGDELGTITLSFSTTDATPKPLTPGDGEDINS